jgi:hypothetical protein
MGSKMLPVPFIGSVRGELLTDDDGTPSGGEVAVACPRRLCLAQPLAPALVPPCCSCRCPEPRAQAHAQLARRTSPPLRSRPAAAHLPPRAAAARAPASGSYCARSRRASHCVYREDVLCTCAPRSLICVCGLSQFGVARRHKATVAERVVRSRSKTYDPDRRATATRGSLSVATGARACHLFTSLGACFFGLARDSR